MRTPTRVSLALTAALLLPVSGTMAQNANPAAIQQVKFTTEQLDNLVASIALYPDPILAQVLIAATFPEQIELAVKYVRARGTNGIDDQPWDVSVRSVAHYAPVLNMMAERPDWTAALGQAYAMQSSDVMESVQHLRQMANAQGNLVSTPEQKVVVDREYIRIEPAQTRVIYVPTYDPAVIYYQPVFYSLAYRRSYWSFGVGFPIGTWLMYDCDWYGRSIFYDDWSYGYGWRYHARPFISFNFVYLQPHYRTVYYNRQVVYHNVNYRNMGRYNTVHRTVNWEDRRGYNDRGYADRGRNDGRNDGRGDGRNGSGNNGRNDGRNGGRADGGNDGRGGAGNGGRGQGTPARNEGRAQYPVNGTRNAETRGTFTPPASVERQPSRTTEQRRPVMPDGGSARPAPSARPSPSRESAPRASAPREASRPASPPARSAPPKGGGGSPPKASSSGGKGKGTG